MNIIKIIFKKYWVILVIIFCFVIIYCVNNIIAENKILNINNLITRNKISIRRYFHDNNYLLVSYRHHDDFYTENTMYECYYLNNRLIRYNYIKFVKFPVDSYMYNWADTVNPYGTLLSNINSIKISDLHLYLNYPSSLGIVEIPESDTYIDFSYYLSEDCVFEIYYNLNSSKFEQIFFSDPSR